MISVNDHQIIITAGERLHHSDAAGHWPDSEVALLGRAGPTGRLPTLRLAGQGCACSHGDLWSWRIRQEACN
jgi:hypothetical protein